MNWLGELNVRCPNLDGTQVAGVTVLQSVLGVRGVFPGRFGNRPG